MSDSRATDGISHLYRFFKTLGLFLVCVVGLNVTLYADSGWSGIKQFGTSDRDKGDGVAVDSSGNVYVTGYTQGVLAGTYAGGGDIFLTKYDSSGTLLWVNQIGTSLNDRAEDVAVDSSGNVYVTGYTFGAFIDARVGRREVILLKHDTYGTQQWVRQIGIPGDSRGAGVAVDSAGNVYVTGFTEGALTGTNAGGDDTFLTKYDSSGRQQWVRQIGTSEHEHATGVAVDSLGNTYVTGVTGGDLAGTGNLGKSDLFVGKYNSSGTQQWIEQTGTSEFERANDVAVDSSGNVYVTGYAAGDLDETNVGRGSVFLMKYDTNGTQQWIEQFGTGHSWGHNVAVDFSGNAYVTGYTDADLGGPNAGGEGQAWDIFLTKYDSMGTQRWIKQIGAPGWDEGTGVAVDSSGNAYVTGFTAGALTGINAGDQDVVLLKYDTDGNLQ